MIQIPFEKEHLKVADRRVHMANERTFLAWIRTSIGIMAFGFVVEKFALFLRQISYFLTKAGPMEGHGVILSPGYSSILGVFLVGLGAIMAVLAYIRFKKIERQIDEDTYQPSRLLDILLAFSVLSVGILLVVIMLHSI